MDEFSKHSPHKPKTSLINFINCLFIFQQILLFWVKVEGLIVVESNELI